MLSHQHGRAQAPLLNRTVHLYVCGEDTGQVLGGVPTPETSRFSENEHSLCVGVSSMVADLRFLAKSTTSCGCVPYWFPFETMQHRV